MGSGFRCLGFEFWVEGLEFRVLALGFRGAVGLEAKGQEPRGVAGLAVGFYAWCFVERCFSAFWVYKPRWARRSYQSVGVDSGMAGEDLGLRVLDFGLLEQL